MKKIAFVVTAAAFALPTLVVAQPDKNAEVRLAKLEQIVVTSDKTQPATYTPDAATKALLDEIAKAK
jgi:hypothetical protein